ncbi:hypothetical protein TPHA_0B02270 [Tetrapisispora phaffii CBS 4417]|uniref:C2H2-type domain-containing protein n=1 Tax=Tetrapisispora phaffii (strain ATCC 24235 / CBS 4417 / NBRC 1672 / NRRL Y-8282 / UCD 70-5) TaxID=1071381 RepID=G8BPG8_TETPH|nr:hypothetical protein TPHA_0B02270 [Tetrapisispora phaffii CBS 4417]CCE61899.1 hypothetical protein TPHA_0B02270 [Tetrapisispora phaffii CBS 4417]
MSAVQFTCNSCVIQFVSSDLQRYHMKTEWHRYNLKRRVAKLTPITADEFAQKLQISELEKGGHDYDEFGFEIISVNGNTDIKHNKRGKAKHRHHHHHHHHSHGDRDSKNAINANEKAKDATPNDNDDAEPNTERRSSVSSKISKLSIDSEESNFDEDAGFSDYAFTSDSNYTSTEDEYDSATDLSEYSYNENADGSVTITECIYCGVNNKEMERNIKHMFSKHGLYLPERSYLVDVSGLLMFLIEVIVVNYQCLCCPFRGNSLEGIRAHMNSKRHCRLPYETTQEKNMFKDFYDFSSLEERNREIIRKPTEGKQSIRFQESDDFDEFEQDISSIIKEHNINSNFSASEFDDSHLRIKSPNGSIAGHRNSLRQNKQRKPIHEESSESKTAVTASDKRLVSGVTEKEFKKGLKKMQQTEKRAVDEHFRASVKRMNFQTHFRDELLQ